MTRLVYLQSPEQYGPVDTDKLQAALAGKRRRRGQVRRRHAGGVRPRRVELPPGPHRRGGPAQTRRRRRGRRGRVPRAGAPVLSRGGGTSLAGPVLQHGRRHRLDQVLPPGGRRSTPGAGPRWSSPGIALDKVNDAVEAVRADGGAEAVHARELHDRRHDRQQLVRLDGPGLRQDGRLGRGAWRSSPTTGLRIWVGETSDEEYERHRGRGGRKAEHLPSAARRSATTTWA